MQTQNKLSIKPNITIATMQCYRVFIFIKMNPLIKKTVEKISSHVHLSDAEKMCVAVEIGNAIYEALIASKENPNFNMKGGNSIDEKTIN